MLRKQGADPGQVVDSTHGIKRPRKALHKRIIPESLEVGQVPAVRADQHLTVTLQIGRQPADEFAKSQLLGDRFLDGRKHRPDSDRRRIPAALGRRLADDGHRTMECLVAEERMQHNAVRDPPRQLEGLITDRHQHQRDVFVERRILHQERILPRRAIVSDNRLALPQGAVDAGRVFHLCGGDPGNAHHIEQEIETPPESERITTAGEPVHRRCHRRRHQRMPGVVICCRRGDPDVPTHRTRGAGQHRSIFDVEPFGQEDRAETQLFRLLNLVDEIARARRMSGQPVATQFGKLDAGNGPVGGLFGPVGGVFGPVSGVFGPLGGHTVAGLSPSFPASLVR